MYSQKAQHILIDVKFNRYPKELEDVGFWQNLGEAALKKGNYCLLKRHFHCFEPMGLSGFWLLSESHLSVHTWPDVNQIFLDLFSCGSKASTKLVVGHLVAGLEELKGRVQIRKELERGFVFSSREKTDQNR